MRNSIIVIFVVLVSNGCQGCFRTNQHEIMSTTTGSSVYKECQCTASGFTINNLLWLDNNDQRIELRPGPGTNSNLFTEVQSDYISLHIPSITKTMSGNYKCITEADGITYTQSYNITAYDPLYFYKTPNDQYLIEGQSSFIQCHPKSDTRVIVTWQKEQDEPIEISNDDKYEITNEGLFIHNVSKNDAGDYKCTARVMATNEEVDKFIKVEVNTIPEVIKLEPYPDNVVVVGEELRIDCLAKGTPNPNYLWNKTLENNTTEAGNVTWRQNVNTLIFDHVKAEDRGLYTCYAFNLAGFFARNIFVEVLVPPVITEFPNITDVEGSKVQLLCNATGNSEPNISITYEGKDLNGDVFMTNDEVIQNGEFITLDRNRKGIYVCNATNEVGTHDIAMYLSVLHKPYFDNPKEDIWGWDGKTVNISCTPDSNPPAKISWRFHKNDIPTEEENEINKNLLTTLNNKLDPYFILNIDNETMYGIYECTATNEHGYAVKRITLQEGFRPHSVTDIAVDDLTATSVTFNISKPEAHIGPDLQGFTVTYDEAKNFDITDIHDNRTWTLDRPFKLDKLKPNSTYLVKFAALNEVGAGRFSEEYQFTTMDKSVPEPPVWSEVPIELKTDSHVLKWREPNDNGEPIEYYTLTYCQELEEESCKTERILSPTTELELADLEFNMTYHLELVAHNAEGDSLPANTSVVVPAPDIYSPLVLLSNGAIIGISIVIVVVCLLLLDVLLLVWRRQGIIATCCYKKETKRKGSSINSRDLKKGLLTPVEEKPAPRPSNGHREYEYNKNTGVVTGKHSEV